MTKNLAKYHTELEAKVALLEETITSMQNVILNLTSRVQTLESLNQSQDVGEDGGEDSDDDITELTGTGQDAIGGISTPPDIPGF